MLKPDLSDDMLDVRDEAGPDEVGIPQEMSHSKVGQDFRDILMNESDADDAKTDQHFDGHAATNSKMANEIEPMEVLKQFVIDQRSGNVKEMVAALNLARSSAKPFARSQVVAGDADPSMEKRKFGLRSSARLPPEAPRIKRRFQIFDEDSRPVPIGSSFHCASSVHLGSSKAKF